MILGDGKWEKLRIWNLNNAMSLPFQISDNSFDNLIEIKILKRCDEMVFFPFPTIILQLPDF